YTNAKGFLAPYRGHRYHLREWGGNRPRTAEEYFNRKHSKVRNVIEKAFGVLKMSCGHANCDRDHRRASYFR
ncbi:hypothetical protein LINPERPRIM_LOCUS40863, partial [Linum perenne]